uniref:C2 domain-containing protein n=1 Tax=Neobodo designis TaxID=312471 RepID=A0A7S1PQ68_NEODS|mmetsp:Transcript_15726/g.48743  ORF Transcript_15726/g.48743 Transcript_15726/m.48743 type:complete len:604 (+) Transcript_15726:65-1876(+)
MAAYAKQAAPVPPPPPAVPAAGPASSDVTRMRLYFRAHDLMDTDTFSKSDPYVLLFANRRDADDGTGDGAAAAGGPRVRSRSPSANHRTFLGKTETVWNNLSPVWQTHIEVDFHFEARQELAYEIYDDDGKGPSGDDHLGNGTFLLSHVVASPRSTLTIQLRTKGTLTITAEEASAHAKDTVAFRVRGVQLKKMDLFGKSDPYYKLFRLLPNGERKLLFQSIVVSETLDPDWGITPAFAMADLTVGGTEENHCLQFECWDENFFKDDKMGQFVCSVAELRTAAAEHLPFRLRHATKPKEYGDIFISDCRVVHIPTFAEMLGAGLEINLAVSIDFTGSNGDPRHPKSLHYVSRGHTNQYESAIQSVGEILMEYDNDKLAPAFGFGAKLPGQFAANHCFHLNGQQDPHVKDVGGILQAYHHTLSQVTLSGPTNFAPTVRQASAAAAASPGVYTILLILTDGCITDTDATIDAIVDAGTLPLSIVIVGVGNADFSLMELLDGDDVRLTNRFGVSSKRDLVQFVPFHAFAAGPRWELAAEVLQEVPSQVEDWAKTHGITPDHFDAQSWAAADDEDYETRLRDVRSPSPPATIGGDRDVASHRVVSPE